MNMTAPAPVTAAEFARTLGAVISRPAIVPVPAFALRLMFGEMAQETMLASQRAQPARLLRAVAFDEPGLAGALGRELALSCNTMPTIAFESLPADARVWVFAADKPLTTDGETALLREVDAFLAQWNAHGSPLTCARRLARRKVSRDQGRSIHRRRVGVLDRRNVSRAPALAAVTGREFAPLVRACIGVTPAAWSSGGSRTEFSTLAHAGTISGSTRVFDTAAATAMDWREKFERAAADSWHKDMLIGAKSDSTEIRNTRRTPFSYFSCRSWVLCVTLRAASSGRQSRIARLSSVGDVNSPASARRTRSANSPSPANRRAIT